MKKILSLIIVIFLITSAAPAFAQMDVPASLQVALFYKIFDFDRNLTETAGQEIVIGIFYDPNTPRSKQAKQEIEENFSKLSERKIGGKSVIIREITAVEQLRGINIVYVTPGNDASINEIVKKCHLYKTLGVSGVEEYAQKGLAIAIELNDQKPRIIINKSGAELCGANLSSKIMALAQII
jgi:hypothetical protein